MSAWDILGIDPTGDESAIKKAYAKKLRLHHPEDDPEGYQRLREAYDSALKQAKQIPAVTAAAAATSQPIHSSDLMLAYEHSLDEESEDVEYDFDADDFFASQPDDEGEESDSRTVASDPIHVFLDQVEEVYEDFSRRVSPAAWEALLADDLLWDLEKRQTILDYLLYYLEDYHYLPRSVWEVLDRAFQLRDSAEELKERYSDDFITYMLHQIEGSMELRYDCFQRVAFEPEFDIDDYLERRELAQTMLMDQEWEDAWEYLSEAHEMFPHDPDLQLMRGKYFLQCGTNEEALACFNHVIELQPDDFDGHWHRASILLEQERYAEAFEDCTILLEQEPQNLNLLVLSGRCHAGLGQLAEAKKQLREAYELDQQHIGSFVYLSIIVNRHLHNDGPIDPAERKRMRKSNLWFGIVMYLRLTWLYLCIYLVLLLFSGFQPVLTGGLIIVLLWYLWRTIRVQRILAT
ncbi:MAG: tetratricopeptide repeat protein [Clostridia bacterium]